MNIKQMHEWYRQYAQQMGMQNVRVLLSEQIDLHINTSIYDTIKNIIAEHIALTNRTVNENSKIGQINSLSTLYTKVDELFDGKSLDEPAYIINNVVSTNTNIRAKHQALYVTSIFVRHKYFKNSDSPQYTDWLPARLIDATLLASSMQDPALAPSINYPIAVIDNTNLMVYLGKNPSTANGKLKRTSVSPYEARIGYIKFPAEVSLDKGISCDLPESLHIDILKHAVDLNTIAIQGSLFNSQKQQQRELQENASQARQQRGEDN